MASELKYFPVAKVGEIPEGEGRPFEADQRMIAVFLQGGKYFAMDDCCPHQGSPLHDGEIHEGTVMCKWHGWRFGLADGKWLDSPRTCVPTHPVRVVGDQIEVGLTD